jgi:magnesium transporter
VDAFFIAIERVSDRMEELEDLIVERPDPEVLSSVHSLRTQMLLFRKAVWPLREAIADLQRSDSAVLGGSASRGLLRDLYDHVLQAVDTVETLRDILSSMVDTYLSSASNRMNQTMQVLTIIATIFIPLTFIAGIYGMNFHFMPELSQVWGYPGALALMAVVAVIMLLYFRRKRWL